VSTWVNGVLVDGPQSKSVQSLDSITATVGAVWNGTNIADCTVHWIRVFGIALEPAEMVDYGQNTTFDYISRASIVLPMTDAFDETTSARAVDGTLWTINGASKLLTRGYAFDETLPSSISVPSITVDGPFSMAVLFRKTKINNQDYLFDSEGTRLGCLFYSDNRLQAVIGGNGSAQLTEGDWIDEYNPNGWNVLVVSHDGTNAIMHMNGTRILFDADAVSFPFTTGTFYLGRYNANNNFALDGSKAWFGLLPLLSQTQIFDLTQRLLTSVNEV
jgi:hypothetical protein